MSNKTKIKRKFTSGRPSIESLSNGEMCLVVPENTVYVKKDFETVIPISTSTGGAQCIIVSSFGTPQENGIALKAAYDEAKTRTPNGLPLSATNRVTLVLTSGKYTPPSRFIVDTQFIDIVSLTGNRDVILTNGILVQANDVFLKGIDVGENAFALASTYTGYPLLKCENCKGGDESFGGNAYFLINTGIVYDEEGYFLYYTDSVNCVIVSGTFIDCEGGNSSFGGYISAAEGYFFPITVSGTFVRCKAISGFGLGTLCSTESIINGLFIDCKTTGLFSSGEYLQLSGTFISCKGNLGSFSGFETSLLGNFTNCEGGFCIVFGAFSGTFNNCKGGFYAEGSYLSGTFNNCKGNFMTFGSEVSGIFNNCKGNTGSFGGDLVTTSGTFNNCIGDSGSFDGIDAVLSGKLYYCRLTSGTFPVVSNGGRTIYCIDGNNTPNNQ